MAFVDEDSALMFLTHSHAGASLFVADGRAPHKLADYPAPHAKQLVRDAGGARVGVVGESFIVWGVQQRAAIDNVLGDAEAAGFVIHGSFATKAIASSCTERRKTRSCCTISRSRTTSTSGTRHSRLATI